MTDPVYQDKVKEMLDEVKSCVIVIVIDILIHLESEK